MIRQDGIELYEIHIDNLKRMINNRLYYSLYSLLNMLNISNIDRDIIIRETNNISYNLYNIIHRHNIASSDYVYYTNNANIRAFGQYMHFNTIDNNADIMIGDDILINPSILLMLIQHFKADSIDSRNRFEYIIINHSNINLDSHNKFISLYNESVNEYECNQAYSNMICADNRLHIQLSFYCKPNDISLIYRKLDKYVMHKTMHLAKQNCGIPAHVNPFIHMDLGLLQIYTGIYNRLYERIKGLATSYSIIKEVDNMVNGINNNELSMTNNTGFIYSK